MIWQWNIFYPILENDNVENFEIKKFWKTSQMMLLEREPCKIMWKLTLANRYVKSDTARSENCYRFPENSHNSKISNFCPFAWWIWKWKNFYPILENVNVGNFKIKKFWITSEVVILERQRDKIIWKQMLANRYVKSNTASSENCYKKNLLSLRLRMISPLRSCWAARVWCCGAWAFRKLQFSQNA